MTVVLVTHEQKLAEEFAQRMLVLSDGRLTEERRLAGAETEVRR